MHAGNQQHPVQDSHRSLSETWKPGLASPGAESKMRPQPLAPQPRQTRPPVLLVLPFPMGMWSVPLANVFAAYDKGHLVPWVLSVSPRRWRPSISPLFVGALADQRMASTRLMRWLAALTSVTMTFTCLLGWRASDALVSCCAQVQALVQTPVWSIASSIVSPEVAEPETAVRSLARLCHIRLDARAAAGSSALP